MKLSEARKRWKHYVFLWKENAISGPGEWARELLGRDLKIERLKAKLHEYTKMADIHEENQSLLLAEIEQLKKDMDPFMAQITQAKTYEVGEDPATYKVSDYPSSGDIKEGEKDGP